MSHNNYIQKQTNYRYLSTTALLVFIVVLAVLMAMLVGNNSAYGSSQDLDKLNRFIQSSNASEGAAKVFREARDFIKDGKWSEAERSFSNFISSYPQDKNVDAALYHMALALKNQSKFQDADTTLARLIEDFPDSNWVGDARVMRVEIAPRLNNTRTIEKGIAGNNDEIRLAALQSLFEANEERAVAVAADLLKQGAGTSRLMKEGAITLLGDSNSKQAAPILSAIARTEPDADLRRTALRALANLDDESALDVLKEQATGSTDTETALTAIRAIADHDSPRVRGILLEIARSNASVELRAQAVSMLGEQEDDSVVDELLKLFNSDKNEEIRSRIISALSEMDNKRAKAAVLQMALSSDNPELRKRAISSLGDSDDESSIDGLIQLYDAEKSEEIKEFIISAFENSDHKKALRKLMDIVRRDPSVSLRKRALSALAESDDPEAAKFLEEIVKKN